jgi:hypothetical protein
MYFYFAYRCHLVMVCSVRYSVSIYLKISLNRRLALFRRTLFSAVMATLLKRILLIRLDITSDLWLYYYELNSHVNWFMPFVLVYIKNKLHAYINKHAKINILKYTFLDKQSRENDSPMFVLCL